jgi:protein-export membrane protein SecD
MLGLTSYFSRLRAAGAALMPSVAVALGLMGVSGGVADDGTARGSVSRTGTVLRYRLDVAQVRNRWLQSIQADARRILKEEKIGHDGVRIAGNQVRVTLRDASKMDQAVQRLRTLAVLSTSLLSGISYDLTVSTGENGLIVIEPTPEGLRGREERTLSQSIDVVRRRVAPEAGADASVTAEGNDGVSVQFAGLDAAEVKARIATPAKLTFQLVDDSMRAEEAQAKGVPPGDELLPGAEQAGRFQLAYKEVAVSGDDLQAASATIDPMLGQPCIGFEFTASGAAALARLTRENIGKPFAIVLDGKVLSAPVIRTEIPSGRGLITGSFTVGEASRMALLLRSGALPAPLSLVEERTIELTGRRRE